MSAITAVNRLVERLSTTESRRLIISCEVVNLDVGSTLWEANKLIRFVYFPYDGFVSMVASVAGHPPMEIALIGNEGMLGASLLLGINNSSSSAIVRGGGTALRIEAPVFRRCLQESPGLHRTISRYLYVLMAQSSTCPPCAHFHEVEPRLARSLLGIQDRAGSDQFKITHQFLADMLGVQRRAVTIAAGALKQRRLISYSRGDITVIDREGLEAASCECYSVVSGHYNKVFG